MKYQETIEAKLFVGLREGYTENYKSLSDFYDFLRKYIKRGDFAITVTSTRFFYQTGEEEGVIIGMINYPRFPLSKDAIKNIIIDLGYSLMKEFNQYRTTVIIGNDTYMLESTDR